ncbi:MAG: M23 family metallopeptidase, partial [Candidatus Firestonebacteria bacterium]|nr:M23 family metallopeptidase [Candidatus Firestonebacteria bacterium]
MNLRNIILSVACLWVVGNIWAKPGFTEKPLIRDIQISTLKIEPGHVLALAMKSFTPDLSVILAGCGQSFKLAALPSEPLTWRGYLAVPLETAPGLKVLTIAVQGGQGDQTQEFEVEVLPAAPRKLEVLHIKNYTDFRFAPESRLMSKLRARSAAQLGAAVECFSSPLPGGRSNANFGVKRVYHPGHKTSVHRGVDLDAPLGTPVCAPADGVVLLARKFNAHGNTTLVDHGFGVVSTFLHQSRILVKPGQKLKAGQTIG